MFEIYSFWDIFVTIKSIQFTIFIQYNDNWHYIWSYVDISPILKSTLNIRIFIWKHFDEDIFLWLNHIINCELSFCKIQKFVTNEACFPISIKKKSTLYFWCELHFVGITFILANSKDTAKSNIKNILNSFLRDEVSVCKGPWVNQENELMLEAQKRIFIISISQENLKVLIYV